MSGEIEMESVLGSVSLVCVCFVLVYRWVVLRSCGELNKVCLWFILCLVDRFWTFVFTFSTVFVTGLLYSHF